MHVYNLECCGIIIIIIAGIQTHYIIIDLNYTAYMNQCMCACTGTVNKAGDTPLSLAYKGGHWEVVKYLAITHHCA